MGFLQLTCLNNSHSLRRQMVFSYSSAAVLTIMAVMILVSQNVVLNFEATPAVFCFLLSSPAHVHTSRSV